MSALLEVEGMHVDIPTPRAGSGNIRIRSTNLQCAEQIWRAKPAQR